MNYIELPLSVAVEKYPFLCEIFLSAGISIDDTDYIVRITDDYCIEIGYRSDSWFVA